MNDKFKYEIIIRINQKRMEWVNPDENLLKREFLSDQHKSAYMLCRLKTAQYNITIHSKQQQQAAAAVRVRSTSVKCTC